MPASYKHIINHRLVGLSTYNQTINFWTTFLQTIKSDTIPDVCYSYNDTIYSMIIIPNGPAVVDIYIEIVCIKLVILCSVLQ